MSMIAQQRSASMSEVKPLSVDQLLGKTVFWQGQNDNNKFYKGEVYRIENDAHNIPQYARIDPHTSCVLHANTDESPLTKDWQVSEGTAAHVRENRFYISFENLLKAIGRA